MSRARLLTTPGEETLSGLRQLWHALRTPTLRVMPQQELHLTDWRRLLLGQAPASFLLEVLLRIALVYLLLLLVVRLLGKRMKGQFSNLEMAVMLVLGAIAGGPTQVPKDGLVPALVLFVGLFAVHQAFTWWSSRSPRFERAAEGHSSAVVADGRLLLDQLQAAGVTNEQLFGALREKSIGQLGELERVYFEINGQFSLLRASTVKPGLSVYNAIPAEQRPLQSLADGVRACSRCGALTDSPRNDQKCPHCTNTSWLAAVAPEKEDGE